MKIANEFTLGVPLDQAWPLLTDLERVAPAMPGTKVDEVDADGVRATMRVKVGPISVAYRVRVELVSRDEATHVAVFKASGRETRGQGTVNATVRATLTASGDETAVVLVTDFAVTGRVAQFGGGVMKEVADRLLRLFATRLEADLAGEPAGGIDARVATDAGAASGAAAGAGASAATAVADEATTGAPRAAGDGGAANDRRAAPAPRLRPAPDPEPIDLGSVAGAALLPSGAAITSFLGAFLGTLFGALLAAALLRRP
ncbi:MAG TPA: SRPBCC family protein [Conexibacter sp.]|jgi:carbon monoxide dehydrogenase subunit G